MELIRLIISYPYPDNLAWNAIRRAYLLTGRVCIDVSNCAATCIAI